jgi:hypothetical protein
MATLRATPGQQPEKSKVARVTRVEMRHEACGGRADLVIANHIDAISYEILCYECGYAESWSVNPSDQQTIQ